MCWFITTRLEHFFWTRHGTEDFLVRHEAERVNGYGASPMTSILMGAWCSEELTSKLHEITALVEMVVTEENIDEKITFSRQPDSFCSWQCPLNGYTWTRRWDTRFARLSWSQVKLLFSESSFFRIIKENNSKRLPFVISSIKQSIPEQRRLTLMLRNPYDSHKAGSHFVCFYSLVWNRSSIEVRCCLDLSVNCVCSRKSPSNMISLLLAIRRF